MGRGRVELKRIENKINRQVTFSKRRTGLMKKAYELSVLCEADVSVIVFSSRGKLYEFCSSSSMLKTLERYQKCSYGAVEAAPSLIETQSSHQECSKLKARVEVLQRTQRNLLGEDLGPLSLKELEQLENQLEMSLKKIRTTKTQLMLNELADHRRKEQSLCEENRDLKTKDNVLLQAIYILLFAVQLLVEAGIENQNQLLWESGGESITYSRHAPNSEGFFQPLDCDPTLQIGYHPVCADQVTAASTGQCSNSFIPGWML